MPLPSFDTIASYTLASSALGSTVGFTVGASLTLLGASIEYGLTAATEAPFRALTYLTHPFELHKNMSDNYQKDCSKVQKFIKKGFVEIILPTTIYGATVGASLGALTSVFVELLPRDVLIGAAVGSSVSSLGLLYLHIALTSDKPKA